MTQKSFIIISVSHQENITNLNDGKKCHQKFWEVHVSAVDNSGNNKNFSISFQRLKKIEKESHFDYLLSCSFRVTQGVNKTLCEDTGEMYDCGNASQYFVEKTQKYFHMDLRLKVRDVFKIKSLNDTF